MRLHLDSDVPNALFALLSDAEREKAARFRFARDRRRFVAVRGRLRELLGTELGVDPASVAIENGAYGKPYLGGIFESSGLHFNVSHSADLAIIGISRGHDIGVDVEALQALDDANDIALQFFSHRENLEYAAVHADEKTTAFFNCWTRKEALVKALGQGLSYPLDDFDVSLAPGRPTRLHRLGSKVGADCRWHLQSFVPAAGFVAALAVSGRHDDCDVCFDDAS
jgi:4'-phosphopantetheinyl transferase